MRHFYRSHLVPVDVLTAADRFFHDLGFSDGATTARARTYRGAIGGVHVTARAEGGHYTFVEVETDQMGESRLDRNVKRFFVTLHRQEDPRHVVQAAY